MILLSVITVVFNDIVGINNTIKSIRSNISSLDNKNNVEFIVIDGLSTDGTIRLIESTDDVPFEFISEKDSGIYDAMNKGIKIARGHWIYFLNAGDVLDNESVLINLLNKLGSTSNNINMLYGAYRADGELKSQKCTLPFLISHMLNHQSMIYDRSLLEHGYDIRYRFCADYAHLLSIWPRLKPQALDLCIANFDTTGVSSQASNKARMWQERLQAVWRSELNIFQKIRLSSRGFIAWPYHIIKIKLSKVR
ncbi:glycosyltransferase [Aeromonas hydrophila]|uniref:glycosyltransferase n=1 Tax=Aeromonas hydrophila TaxID=644 RepID=UPI00191EA0E3|nr:glycosyltransferase [Aeromonas hydrophila]MBL0575010.1 glycosyltransferase [Aeromonas hydrophila]